MSIADLSNDDDVEVTSRTYLFRILMSVIAAIIFFTYALRSWDENKLLIILVIFPLIFLCFYLNCIDISIINNSEIKLFRFEKIITYSHIKKIGTLPIFSRGFGTTYTVCYIIYFNSDNKRKIRFFYIAQKKVELFELLKKIISSKNRND